jgi:colanic acid/amylovoran biosynthesis glycosyltransferase
VVRRDLFKVSEPFITDQASAHENWQPLFVGDHRSSSGPAWATSILASERARLRSMAGDRTPTVVHAHFAIDAVLGARIARRFGAPLVVTLHGFDVTRSRRSMLMSGRPRLLEYCLKRRTVLRNAAVFLAVSDFIREAAIQAGFPAERLRVHHIGIPVPGIELPVRLDSGADVISIIHVARLVENKGTATLIRAIALLRDRGVRTRLTVIGDGPEKDNLVALSAELDIAAKVRFEGARPHDVTRGMIAANDILCVPSQRVANGDSEGFGMVLLEAGAAGTPIVASATGGITDFVEDGVTGVAVPERDVEALATGLSRVIASDELREGLRTNAWRRLVDDFDVRKQTNALETVFDEILTARSRG